MVDPQVLKPMLEADFGPRLAFMDFLVVDYTLVGQPGSKVSIPQFKYIGPATVVAEGEMYPVKQLETSMVEYTIHKYANALALSDELILSAYGNPLGETIRQLAYSIADAYNADVAKELSAIPANMTHEYETLNGDAIATALSLFGENDVEAKSLYVNPLQLAELRINADWINATDKGVDAMRSGSLGRIWGCDVFDSELVPKDEAYIVKRGFATLFLKRDTQLETERVILNGTHNFAANKHGMVATTDATKGIKLVKGAPTGGDEG